MSDDAAIDLRTSLETHFDEIDKGQTPSFNTSIEVVEPSASQAETVQQSEPGAASESTASDPVASSPSSEGNEGSEATLDDIGATVGKALGDSSDPVDQLAVVPPSDPPAGKIDQAPASWKGDAKQLWKDLPVAARQEVIRRERDTLRVLQDSALDRRRVQEITQVLNPHMERIAANYQGNPLLAINNLLETERTLMSGTPLNKAQLVANIINNFGIDLSTLDKILVGQPPPENIRQQSEVDRLVEERLRPVLSYVQQQQTKEQQATQQAQARIVETVETMAADNTKYPYFEEVRLDMADIVEMNTKRGVDISLEEAYNRAVRMNGHTAAAVETRQSSQAATQTALQAHQEAQAAKGAAVSIAGSPTSVSGPTVDATDLRSLISSQLDSRSARI